MCEQTGLLCECAGCRVVVLADDIEWTDRGNYCQNCFDNTFIVCNGCNTELHRDYDDIFIMISDNREVPYCHRCLANDNEADDY